MANRSIFEEVDTAEKPAVQTGLIDRAARRGSRRAVRAWLAVLFGLVVLMIAVGGLTRLTDSGLSITEWAPIKGAIPPRSVAEWEAEFDAYRAIPEYQLQNKGMSMAEFKVIYWWEWGHRQLGRVIGLVWGLGLLGLWVSKSVPSGWMSRLLGLGVLGGLQGAIGWWMVSSGLRGTMLDVASYRLATHLGLAFIILSLIAWYMISLSRPQAELLSARRGGDARLRKLSTGLLTLTFLQILIGALVAGIDAGRNYVDWPLMAGAFTPPEMWVLDPWWRNLFENDGTVQFFHRIAGYLLFAFATFVWLRGRRSGNGATVASFHWVMAGVVAQVVLGIVTVMNSAPWHLAILHQFGAVVLMVLILRARHRSMYPHSQSVRT